MDLALSYHSEVPQKNKPQGKLWIWLSCCSVSQIYSACRVSSKLFKWKVFKMNTIALASVETCTRLPAGHNLHTSDDLYVICWAVRRGLNNSSGCSGSLTSSSRIRWRGGWWWPFKYWLIGLSLGHRAIQLYCQLTLGYHVAERRRIFIPLNCDLVRRQGAVSRPGPTCCHCDKAFLYSCLCSLLSPSTDVSATMGVKMLQCFPFYRRCKERCKSRQCPPAAGEQQLWLLENPP